jgi:predicted hotdog family 3-hydroxylacyl-ACP dehydratase
MSLKPCPYPIERLLPHAAPMILIDKVVGWSETELMAEVTVRANSMFLRPGRGVPAHVAIEWMAQSCGALTGVQALESGEPVRIGFLLGTRNFSASVPWFPLGSILQVTVSATFRDQETAVLDCTVAEAATVRAQARLTVYQPRDLTKILGKQLGAAREAGLA